MYSAVTSRVFVGGCCQSLVEIGCRLPSFASSLYGRWWFVCKSSKTGEKCYTKWKWSLSKINACWNVLLLFWRAFYLDSIGILCYTFSRFFLKNSSHLSGFLGGLLVWKKGEIIKTIGSRWARYHRFYHCLTWLHLEREKSVPALFILPTESQMSCLKLQEIIGRHDWGS